MNRLTKRSENGTGIYIEPSDEPTKWERNRHGVLQKLAEYEDLEEQGRLHIAPIADGTDIFVPYTDWFDDENVKEVIEDTYLHGYTEFENGEMNKGWFLTREEAEKALEAADERD